MSSERLIDAIGKIDDRFIQEADASRVKKTATITPMKRRVYQSVAAAACIALVGVGAIGTMSKSDRYAMKEAASESAAIADTKMMATGAMNTTTEESILESDIALDTVPSENAVEEETGITVAAVVNPMRGVTFAEMTEEVHIKVYIPEDAKENSRFIYDLEGEKLAEVNFTYEDKEYTLRVQKTEALEDIAGLYYTFDVDDSFKGTWLKLNTTDKVGSISWYNDGYTYCLIMTQNADRETLENMYSLVMDFKKE